jgi:hypothetical protein
MSFELEKAWLDFVDQLEELKERWDWFQGLRMSAASLRTMHPEFQRVLARVNHRANFENALDALMGFWRVNGGLSALRPKVPEEELMKEEEDE